MGWFKMVLSAVFTQFKSNSCILSLLKVFKVRSRDFQGFEEDVWGSLDGNNNNIFQTIFK